jgi:hypothetical protein
MGPVPAAIGLTALDPIQTNAKSATPVHLCERVNMALSPLISWALGLLPTEELCTTTILN